MTGLALVGVGCAIAAYGYFAVLSVILAVIDVRTHRLPNRHVLPAYVVAAVLLTAAAICIAEPGRLIPTVGGGLALFVFYLVLGMLRPGAMGGGDVKLAGVVGAFLGFLGWESLLGGALAGFVLGGVFAAVVLISGRSARTRIAFGPFMLAGAWWAIIAAAVASIG